MNATTGRMFERMTSKTPKLNAIPADHAEMPSPPYPPVDDALVQLTIENGRSLLQDNSVTLESALVWGVIHGYYEGYIAAAGEDLRPTGAVDWTFLSDAIDSLPQGARITILKGRPATKADGWVRLCSGSYATADGRLGVRQMGGTSYGFEYLPDPERPGYVKREMGFIGSGDLKTVLTKCERHFTH